ncbi:hypothetical protein Anapl_01649 [Anas platyrhynchos]|uniref:Uncharacterized protein n=1 Tax=Anas platyrhynchos TaxID=8839 RepID=R0KBX7_ANAPL|nr:hypothetical protein Anapl_01649 [Anas platyrhynchos]
MLRMGNRAKERVHPIINYTFKATAGKQNSHKLTLPTISTIFNTIFNGVQPQTENHEDFRRQTEDNSPFPTEEQMQDCSTYRTNPTVNFSKSKEHRVKHSAAERLKRDAMATAPGGSGTAGGERPTAPTASSTQQRYRSAQKHKLQTKALNYCKAGKRASRQQGEQPSDSIRLRDSGLRLRLLRLSRTEPPAHPWPRRFPASRAVLHAQTPNAAKPQKRRLNCCRAATRQKRKLRAGSVRVAPLPGTRAQPHPLLLTTFLRSKTTALKPPSPQLGELDLAGYRRNYAKHESFTFLPRKRMHIHVLAKVTNNITRRQSRELEKKRTHQVIPSLELAGNNSFILNLYRARKAGECKADAILERNREKSFLFHFPVTEAWCGSSLSLSLGRKEGKIALLPSTS